MSYFTMAMYDLTVSLILSEMKTYYLVDIEELSLYYQDNGCGVV